MRNGDTMTGENVYQAGPRIVIQAVDEKGNPLGRAIEINEDAVIAVGGRKREVMSRNGERFHVYDVKVRTSGKEDTIEGIYGIFEDDLKIELLKNRAIISYVSPYPTLLYNFRRGSEGLEPLTYGIVLNSGEKVELQPRPTYREVERKGDIPVVDEKVYLRIKVLPALVQKLYQ